MPELGNSVKIIGNRVEVDMDMSCSHELTPVDFVPNLSGAMLFP